MVPRVHRGTIAWLNRIRRSELHGDTGVERRFGAAVGAPDGTSDHNVTDAQFGIVVEAELVLPVAVGNPHRHELRVLLSPDRLAGVESQTNGFAVQFRLGRGARYANA